MKDYSKSVRFKLWDYYSDKAMLETKKAKLYTKVANFLYSDSWDNDIDVDIDL